jgi:hypothetical protein
MDAAQEIRDAVAEVVLLRLRCTATPELAAAVLAIKRFQALRFAGTYTDLLQSGSFQSAARFFLEELYGDRDYAKRDAQFARIAGALQSLFPLQVVQTAVSLAKLHLLTERLDHAMAQAWLDHKEPELRRYVLAWRVVGQRIEREQQLREVLDMGSELARLTRTPGLRLMLKMMHKPAQAAGLASLQRFLENGFDTFGEMARTRDGVSVFLGLIRERESALIELLFNGDAVACETLLAATLGQAR